jgi:type VI secretion system protein ImpA
MDGHSQIDAVAISTDAPCGRDLFEAGDTTFMNFTVGAEGLLPASFYSKRDGTPFDRGSVDLGGSCKIGHSVLERTYDIRVLSLLAKLHALNRDAEQAIRIFEQTADILERFWDEIHPRAEEGDWSYRVACLQALDDNTHIVLPLQYAPVLQHQQIGDLTVRAVFVATGKSQAREDERLIALSDLDRAMSEIDLSALKAARSLFARLASATDRIRATWLERAGYDQAVRFDMVTPFANKAHDALAGYVTRREPASTTNEQASAIETRNAAAMGEVAHAGTFAVATFAQAESALSASASFFARNEPSNPALPLIRQAQQLMGKSFLDVLRILAPSHVEAASFNIGKGPYLPFPVERLAEFSETTEPTPTEEEPRTFVAGSRQEAVSLLTAVNGFYAKHEPSSPLPLFTERASALAGRDFLGIMKDVLPEDAMKMMQKDLP